MADKKYDLIIIGGGPAGLSAAQYAARANLKTLVLDKSASAGALAYTEKIENYPGVIGPVSGKELLDTFRTQALYFGAEYIETQVTGVKLEDDIKEVYGISDTYKSSAVIISTGSMGRKPAIKGEERYLGKGVSYCAICDAAFYRGQDVCVLGHSEEAIKEAIMLTGFASKVYLIVPSHDFRASDHPELDSEKIVLMKGYKIISIKGTEYVTAICVKNIDTAEEKTMRIDGVFIYLHGSQPIVDFLGSTINLNENRCILTHRMTETSIPGVYAAGDVTCSEMRQVVTAAACGCIAALSAEKYIRHRSRSRYDWAKS